MSAEVLDEYRRIQQWLERQAALLGPVGDTMHGLAAEALDRLIEREHTRHRVPLYGMLDIWQALYGTSHPEFDEFYAEHGYAETWARLCAEVDARRPDNAVWAAHDRKIAAEAFREARDDLAAMVDDDLTVIVGDPDDDETWVPVRLDEWLDIRADRIEQGGQS